MTALSTMTGALERELAVPGNFVNTFPDATDSDIVGYLADAFGEAQLFGFFPDVTLTPVSGGADFTASPDLSLAGQALILIFAATRVIRAQLRALNTSATYKSGPVEYSVQKAATLLNGELSYLKSRLDELIANGEAAARAAAGTAFVYDNYLGRTGMDVRTAGIGGFYWYEVRQSLLGDFYAYSMGRP